MMMCRDLVSAGRRAPVSVSLLGILAGVAAALAINPTAAWACPNEQVRGESNINPVTLQHYSEGLPDCRAYEMVSPLYKQGYDAVPLAPFGGLAVAPSGDAVAFMSEGSFSEPVNFKVGTAPENPYVSQRNSRSGWITSSALPPANLIEVTNEGDLQAGDTSPDLRSNQVACGLNSYGKGGGKSGESGLEEILCGARTSGGEWNAATAVFRSPTGFLVYPTFYLGGASNLSRIFFQPNENLMPSDILPPQRGAGIYEVSGVGTASPVLRLVNVDNEGNELVRNVGGKFLFPLFGDLRVNEFLSGSAYDAISASGETVFFAASQKGSNTVTLFARVACHQKGAPCRYVENVEPYIKYVEEGQVRKEGGRVTEEGLANTSGEPTGRETVAVSARGRAPECTGACASSEEANATFQAASADGSKVFFTTAQQLLNNDTNHEYDLYEYHFVTKTEEEKGEKPLTLISGGQPNTKVDGVVRSSADGSHVYFLESGEIPGAQNENGEHEKASPGANMYGYDTVTHETKFVAHTTFDPGPFEGAEEQLAGERFGDELSSDNFRPAWTTPDGAYLAFSTSTPLAGDLNVGGAEAVYRFSFGGVGEPGELTWVSHGAPGFKEVHEGKNALLPWLQGTQDGSFVNREDFNRPMSGESEAEAPGKSREERHDGEYIVFGTSERLQSNDVNAAPDVYEWHCASSCAHPAVEGKVEMISDGSGPQGVANSSHFQHANFAISTSGSDVIFTTLTALVGQDTDVLRDVYDARVNGGFRRPVPEPSCSGEACQREQSLVPSFPLAASSVSPASGNLSAGGGSVAPAVHPTPKSLTRAQTLGRALKACKARPRKKRAACEAQAKRKYGAKTNNTGRKRK
jgi:hypothetical protein